MAITAMLWLALGPQKLELRSERPGLGPADPDGVQLILGEVKLSTVGLPGRWAEVA